MFKKWVILLLPLLIVACSDSATNSGSPSQAAAPDTTDSAAAVPVEPSSGPSIVTEEIEYQVDGQPFTGYLAYDATIEGKRPGVLVVHEWWGHNEYARTRAVQLARMGYVAFALDMYGTGKVADHPDNAKQFMQEAMKSPEQVKARFLKAKALLEQQAVTDADKMAAIGYCFGGGVVLNMARAGVDLDGVASFHGALNTVFPPVPGGIKAKILVLHGADDSLVPPELVEAFKAEMEQAGADYRFISYPGAKHSFTNPGATAVGEKYGMPLAYDEAADEQSWSELSAFLQSLWSDSSTATAE